MTNAQKLEALVVEGGKRGYNFRNGYKHKERHDVAHMPNLAVPYIDKRGEIWYIPYQVILFNHDFARALFGETKPLENGEYPPEVVLYKGKPVWHPWSRHLQQAVISEDPIGYMYRAVFGDAA